MNTSRRIPRQLVKALAAGAVLVAAALPLAIATTAGAASAWTTVAFSVHGATTNTIGTGASGTFTITGPAATFAADGSTTTVTSTAPGLTFSSVTEPAGGATVTGSFASTSATVPGNYTLTVTDDAGAATSTTTATGVVVEGNATITTVSPATPVTQANGNITTPTVVTITGSGFVTGATVTFQNTTDGTSLSSASAAGGITLGVAGANQGTSTFVSATSLTATVSPTNSITGATEAAGTYNVTVVNPDGGTTVDAGALTVIPYGITSVTPSAIVGVATLTNTVVTIAGAGFEPGATVSLTGCGEADGVTPLAISSVVSATSITATVPETGTPPELCGLTISNPTIAAGGNNATYSLPGALGISEASTVAPTITATNATSATALVPGAAATTVTLTGTGFSQYSSAAAFVGTGVVGGGVTLNNPVGNTGTSITFNVLAVTGATAGPFNVVVSNTAAASNAFPAAVFVAGPTITSQTPVGLAVGAPVGTVVTLTGTGFTSTDTGVVTDNGGVLQGIFTYVSATTINLVITVSPTAADQTGPPSLVVSQQPGPSVSSPSFTMKIDAAPVVIGSLTYAAGTDVGVGAVAQTVTINGTGFAAGATVGTFINGNSVADPNVTATVTSINLAGTQIKATISIKAPDTNIADGYSVTNTDGGVAKVPAGLSALIIGAGPTITSVSPATGAASATTAFTITGTGFQTGASVAASSDGTCGSATVVSATSITVSCTLGAATATPVTLAVTNVDGGSASSTAVLVATAPVVTFHVGATHGTAVVGKTVTLTISGTGFSGQPKITSSAAGVKAVVSHDTGKLLTVKVTVAATGKAGEHTFTVRLSNGSSGRTNYATKG